MMCIQMISKYETPLVFSILVTHTDWPPQLSQYSPFLHLLQLAALPPVSSAQPKHDVAPLPENLF